ncbi:hypothetical protein OIU74_001089 [Salix koriyanagi]|uniref:Uncharacterized protein n=1 Tax=Salix koriyanagi TaxID=2511006 RepID=A0A9Q1AMN5_9ROSI|nr:hypothetical protein OIU74_001089 [Salix koriyanagi]
MIFMRGLMPVLMGIGARRMGFWRRLKVLRRKIGECLRWKSGGGWRHYEGSEERRQGSCERRSWGWGRGLFEEEEDVEEREREREEIEREFVVHFPLLDENEIAERMVLEKKKIELSSKYASDSLMEEQTGAKVMLNIHRLMAGGCLEIIVGVSFIQGDCCLDGIIATLNVERVQCKSRTPLLLGSVLVKAGRGSSLFLAKVLSVSVLDEDFS